MECPRCGGKGKYMREFGGYRPCEYCNGTGKVWQTNEEWLRSLSTTEELTDAIYNMVITHPWSFNKETVLRWLKGKHEEAK